MERAGVQRVPSSRWLSPAERLARREQELQVLAQGRFLRLVKAERWEYAERINTSGVVIIVPVTTENELLLIEQHRPPLGRRCLEFPAGLVGDRPELNQEPPLDAVRRELEEETGYAADNIRLLGHASPTAGLTSELVSVYLATGLRRVSAGGGAEGEQILVHRVPWSEAGAWLARRAGEGLEVAMSVYGGMWWAADALQHPAGPAKR
jgi:ADP-ribose pyrophosphatase